MAGQSVLQSKSLQIHCISVSFCMFLISPTSINNSIQISMNNALFHLIKNDANLNILSVFVFILVFIFSCSGVERRKCNSLWHAGSADCRCLLGALLNSQYSGMQAGSGLVTLREAPPKLSPGSKGHCPNSDCTPPPSSGHSGALYFRTELSNFVKLPCWWL